MLTLFLKLKRPLHCRGGNRVFMCIHDLQKTFDSVECAVLFDRLFNAGLDVEIVM